MKIFSAEQIKGIDNYTIIHEPVASTDLMERAASAVFKWIADRYERNRRFLVFAGPGNNGGDGLALARLLSRERYDVEAVYVKFTDNTSADWKINFERLKKEQLCKITEVISGNDFPVILSDDIIIDAIFGSGLSRPAEGLPARIIRHINECDALKISIDMPSGLFCDDNAYNDPHSIIKANHTLSFQFPKLSFMFSENEIFTGEWEILPIGLSETSIADAETPYRYLCSEDILPLLNKRHRFDHKGVYGHGLLVAGSTCKMGAAVLSARAALRTGLGLLTCHIPSSGRTIMQTSVPEAMVVTDKAENLVSDIDISGYYSAAGIGPGLGTDYSTQRALRKFMSGFRNPVVVDADAINILAVNKEWFTLIHPGMILTPHPKEFERLTGISDDGFSKMKKQLKYSRDHNCVMVLKGAHTSVTTPDGLVYFNSTGNPGMATAGSGDVLTGMILSLLSQGYTPENAACTGVFIHGLAGDIGAEKTGYEALLASDIINNIGLAYKSIRKQHSGL